MQIQRTEQQLSEEKGDCEMDSQLNGDNGKYTLGDEHNTRYLKVFKNKALFT